MHLIANARLSPSLPPLYSTTLFLYFFWSCLSIAWRGSLVNRRNAFAAYPASKRPTQRDGFMYLIYEQYTQPMSTYLDSGTSGLIFASRLCLVFLLLLTGTLNAFRGSWDVDSGSNKAGGKSRPPMRNSLHPFIINRAQRVRRVTVACHSYLASRYPPRVALLERGRFDCPVASFAGCS